MRKATMRSLAGLSVAAMLPLAPAGAMTIFVSIEKGNSITVIDGDTMEVTATVDVANRPRGIALSEDNSLLYICVGDDDHIEVLYTESLEVVYRSEEHTSELQSLMRISSSVFCFTKN